MCSRLVKWYRHSTWRYAPNNRFFLNQEADRYANYIQKNYEPFEQIKLLTLLIDKIREQNEQNIKKIEEEILKNTSEIETLGKTNNNLNNLLNK